MLLKRLRKLILYTLILFMSHSRWPEIKYLSERAILLHWGSTINPALNRSIHHLGKQIQSHPFPGFKELVPAYSSLAVYYDPTAISLGSPSREPWLTVRDQLENFLKSEFSEEILEQNEVVRIPVLYNGPDLISLANSKSLSVEEVILIHSSCVYDVFMLGFLPGFAYLGLVDDRIASPRLASPRTNVPAGSVGIAGNQTGIYPVASPGGWQLIGTTPVKMFDPNRVNSSLLSPGDRVQFCPIDESGYLELKQAQ